MNEKVHDMTESKFKKNYSYREPLVNKILIIEVIPGNGITYSLEVSWSFLLKLLKIRMMSSESRQLEHII